MTLHAVGTVTGKSADGQHRTISVDHHDGVMELTSHTLDRQRVEAPEAANIEGVLALAKAKFGLVDATFIPAHGATGGKDPF